MEDLILLIVYLILLGLVIIYGGVIAYHVFKYRYQLPYADAQKAVSMLWMYILAGLFIIILSLTIGFIYWWTI